MLNFPTRNHPKKTLNFESKTPKVGTLPLFVEIWRKFIFEAYISFFAAFTSFFQYFGGSNRGQILTIAQIAYFLDDPNHGQILIIAQISFYNPRRNIVHRSDYLFF